ncbi:MAG: helix-turn-helix transcriptional regulator [Clostridia bacterium]|nr:helix-turn-helix transcriptional regulator [Clostridia bacterium]
MYGKRIRELRLEKGMTQAQLAEMLRTTQKNISKYETEYLDLSTAMIVELCKIFEVSADYLLGIEELFSKI